MSVPYSPEYLGLDINYSLLNRLAERTGGKVLRPEAVEDAAQMLFTTPAQNISTLQDYWPWFVVLALCLFIGEIAIRQLLLPSAWTTPRQRREILPETVPEYAYGELEAIVHHRAEERRRRTTVSRDGIVPVRLPLTRPGIFIWPVCGIGGGNPETFYVYLLTPFRGVRYSAQCLPHLEEIMTPPYDVITRPNGRRTWRAVPIT